MKKQRIFRSALLLVYTVLLGVFLTGCSAGSRINTVLTVEADGSGVRQMDIVIDSGVFSQYFKGTAEDLHSIVTMFCPAEMEAELQNSSETLQLKFQVTFSDTEEYRKKIAAIIGEEPEIEITLPDSIWVNGIYVKESFESSDLLTWLRDALIEGQYVDAGNADMIFADGSTEVSYKGQKSNVSSQIELNQVEYVTIDSIQLFTDINGLDDYSRKIVFTIPGTSMDKKGTEISGYFHDMKCEVEEEQDGDKTLFCLFTKNVNADALETFDREVFGAENAELVQTNVDESFSPFVFSRYWKERVNFANYIAGENTGTRCTYYVSAAPEYHFYQTEDFANLSQPDAEAEEYPEYYHLDSRSVGSEDVFYPLLVQREYRVFEMNVSMEKNLTGSDWSRNSEFVFGEIPEQERADEMVKRLSEKAGLDAEETPAGSDTAEAGEPAQAEGEPAQAEGEPAQAEGETAQTEAESEEVAFADTKIASSQSEEEGIYKIKIAQKGKKEEIQKSSEKLFGNGGDFYSASDSGFWKVKKMQAFEENMDYAQVLGNVSDGFVIHYQTDPGIGSALQYCNLEPEDVTLKNGRLQAEIYHTRINILYAVEKVDGLAVLFWIAAAAGIVCFLLMLIKMGVFKRKAKSPARAQTYAAAESVPVIRSASAAGNKKFCEKCGAPRAENTSFCEKCGNKF